VVILDLHVLSASFGPAKANAPLIVDPNAVLASPIAFECLQPVAWWHSKSIQRRSSIEQVQLAIRGFMDAWVQSLRRLSTPDLLGVAVGERSDHKTSI